MAVRPLRPATDRRLGGPLPRQLANRTRAPLQAPGLAVPGFDPRNEPRMSCGISTSFPVLFPTRRQITHALLTRSPLYSGSYPPFRARLACVRHAASVDSEPGSNSRLNRLAKHKRLKATHAADVLDHFSFELKLLTKLRPDIPLRKRRCASST